MKSLLTIEVKGKNSKVSNIVFDWEHGHYAIYEFKKVAKSNVERLYQQYKERLHKKGIKPIPRKDFIVKEYSDELPSIHNKWQRLKKFVKQKIDSSVGEVYYDYEEMLCEMEELEKEI